MVSSTNVSPQYHRDAMFRFAVVSEGHIGSGKRLFLQFADRSLVPLYEDQFRHNWFKFDGKMFPYTHENITAAGDEQFRRYRGLKPRPVAPVHPPGCDNASRLSE